MQNSNVQSSKNSPFEMLEIYSSVYKEKQANREKINNFLQSFINTNDNTIEKYSLLRNLEKNFRDSSCEISAKLKNIIDSIWKNFVETHYPMKEANDCQELEIPQREASTEKLKDKINPLAVQLINDKGTANDLNFLQRKFLLILARNSDLLNEISFPDLGTGVFYDKPDMFIETIFKIIDFSSCVRFACTKSEAFQGFGIEWVTKIPSNVKELALSKMPLSDSELNEIYKRCASVEVLELDFPETEIKPSVEAINQLLKKLAPNLKSLKISGDVPGIENFSVFSGISFNKLDILEIDCKKAKITSYPLSNLLAPNLKELSISCKNLDIRVEESLPPNLETIKLTVPELHQFYVALIVQRCKKLQTIHLNFPGKEGIFSLTDQTLAPEKPFTAEDVKQVLAQANLNEIKEIKLTGIQYFGPSFLHGLNLPNLNKLEIQANKIEKDALSRLEAAPNLTALSLTFTEPSVIDLSKFKLKELTLDFLSESGAGQVFSAYLEANQGIKVLKTNAPKQMLSIFERVFLGMHHLNLYQHIGGIDQKEFQDLVAKIQGMNNFSTTLTEITFVDSDLSEEIATQFIQAFSNHGLNPKINFYKSTEAH